MSAICINSGFYNTKLVVGNEKHIFESAIQPSISLYDKNVVVIEGQKYVVGQGEHDITLDKTTNLTQMACILYSLQRYGAYTDTIISCLPVDVYLNEEAKVNYEAMLKKFTPNIITAMEGHSAVLHDPNFYKGRLICLIDVGGLTINSMIIDDGHLIKSTAQSIQLGTIILNHKIKKYLQQKDLVNVPEYQVKYLAQTEAQEVVEEYIEELKSFFKRSGYPTNIEYRFIGGGALTYKDTFEKHFNAYISDDAIWENVYGLKKLGEMLNVY